MNVEAVALLVEFAIQTVFLFTALWIMIKLQKLNYTFPGLIGSAVLTSALDLIPHFGHLLSAGVLLICIWKVSQPEFVDVAFLVFVGYALMFGMNLWLIGILMGDLTESAQETPVEARELQEGSWEDPTLAEGTTNPSVAFGTKPAASDPPSLNAPAEPASFPAAAPENPTEFVLKHFAVKGITRNADKSSVALFSGVKTYTLFVGDSVLMEVPNGSLAVRLEGLGQDRIELSVEGKPLTLTLR